MTMIDISQELSTGTWNIDPAHSSVEFVIRHLGLSKVRGRFNSFTGSVTVGSPQTVSSVEVTVDLGSVDTNNVDRDNHLRSTDIFNIDAHPQMTFRSTAVTPAGDDARSVTAMAAMLAHEVKNPLSGIRGAAQLLEQSAGSEDQKLTRLICDETDRICAPVAQNEQSSEHPA